MQKKVMHLIHSGGFYGAEAVVLNLCIGLRDKNYPAVVGCFCDKNGEKPLLGSIAESKGIKVEYIQFKHKFDFRVINELRKRIDQHNIGLLHSHGYKPSFYCVLIFLLYRVPYVITCHLWTKETFRASVYTFLEKLAMLFSRKNIAVSRLILESIFSWRLLKKKGVLINNGVDITRYGNGNNDYKPDVLRNELGLRNDTIIIGSLGRLAFQKAHHIFIESAAGILNERNDIEFLLAGEGHRFAYLKEMVKKFGIMDSFHFLGFRKDALNIIRLVDIFILCSLDEGLPIALLEAMSLGKPIIATTVGEIPYIIKPNFNGILVRPGSSFELLNAMNNLLNDKKLLEAISSNALATIGKKYSIDRMTAEYLTVYRSVIRDLKNNTNIQSTVKGNRICFRCLITDWQRAFFGLVKNFGRSR